MSSQALAELPHVALRPQPAMPATWQGPLNALRSIALECRSAAHSDLFKACAMLSNKKDTARDAHARALLKCLRQAIGRQPVLFRPGVTEVSFDEAWLMRAIDASQSGDADSFVFLIRSRVPTLHQRPIAFLIKGISKRIERL